MATSTTFTTLRKVVAGSVAEIVLNRPSALNAMNGRFFEEIHTAFQEVEKDPNVNCALLWAEGRMFTAGLDLKEAASLFTNDNSKSKAEQSAELYKHIKQLQQVRNAYKDEFELKPTLKQRPSISFVKTESLQLLLFTANASGKLHSF